MDLEGAGADGVVGIDAEEAEIEEQAATDMGFLSTEPLTPLARQLAVVEAIIGQLYVAVLIARIVALSTAGAMKSAPTPP